MPFDLLDNIDHSFNEDVRSSLASLMEVEEESIVHDLPVVSAAVVAGLIKKSSSIHGMGTLAELLVGESSDSVQSSESDGADVRALLSDKSSVAEGTNTLDRVFGSGLDDLIGAVARYCKLPKYKLRDLFGAVGKSCMSSLAALQQNHDFETEDVAAVILKQGGKVSSTLPDNLFSALGLNRKSSFATKLKAERFEKVEKALAKSDSSDIEKTLLKRLLPVAIIVLVLLITWVVVQRLM